MAITASPTAPPQEIEAALEAGSGPLAGRSDRYAFDVFTHYYAAEMGLGLTKWLAVFVEPMAPEALAGLKLAANGVERAWADEAGRRRVNLDPGYLTPLALVLASTKPAAHRIYLRDGVYAEVTLRYDHGAYAPLPWTYPDFRQPLVAAFLAAWRPRALELASAARTPDRAERSGPSDA